MAQVKAQGDAGGESVQSVGTEEKKVIFASSLGTVFEWYDFYLYATLAPFFAALFFPSGNETAALLSAFATYAAGFLVRPFGAIVFGRIGDLVGRKYTFLITIVFMGGATFLVGLLPTFQTIGWAAPVLLVTLRLVQGLALGGEYGGAATYVAEHAPHNDAAMTRAGSRPRRPGLLPGAGGDRRRARLDGCQGLRGMGLADSVLAIADPAGVLDLYPVEAA
jgi:MFS family permease